MSKLISDGFWAGEMIESGGIGKGFNFCSDDSNIDFIITWKLPVSSPIHPLKVNIRRNIAAIVIA